LRTGLGATRQGRAATRAEKSKEKADVLHAIYDLITVAGPEIVVSG
jgi:hypothetical protein